jgi:hypothetical protein
VVSTEAALRKKGEETNVVRVFSEGVGHQF